MEVITMSDSREIELLKWTIVNQRHYIDALESAMRDLKMKLSTNIDNLDYLVGQGVLSGPLNESLVVAMKQSINLRENNFLASIEEIDDYFTK
jgi:hypothetical protein